MLFIKCNLFEYFTFCVHHFELHLFAVDVDSCNGFGAVDFIVAFDIDEQVLDKYVGVGYYKCEGYKIEYRIPRNEINSSIIKDVIEFYKYKF